MERAGIIKIQSIAISHIAPPRTHSHGQDPQWPAPVPPSLPWCPHHDSNLTRPHGSGRVPPALRARTE